MMDKRRNLEDMYPLTPMQQGLLFHTLLTPATGVYIPQIALTLEGELDSAALQRAWRQTMARYTVLRTSFYWEAHEEPFQVVWRQVELPWAEHDWRSVPDHEQTSRLQALLEHDRITGFALNIPPLMRLALVRKGDHLYQMIWSYHHLILDGWSAGIILQDVFSHYAAPSSPTLPVRPYSDYIAWLRQQDEAASKTFWQRYLKNVTQATDIPLLAPSQAHQTKAQWDEQQLVVAADDLAILRTFAQQHQLTLNTCVQGAFGLLLSRYGDRPDVIFGATCAGRPPTLAGSASMAGLFINTLPVRVRVADAAPVATWLQQLQAEHATATAYEHTALMSIQEWSGLPAGEALFKSLLVFENYPVEAGKLPRTTALQLKAVEVAEWTHFPLTLQVAANETLTLTAKYNRAQIDPDTMTRLLGHLQTVFIGLAVQPQRSLRDVPLLSVSERQHLARWNQTCQPYPLDRPLPDGFEAQAEKTPDAIAVMADDQCLTYRDLNAQSNQLAHVLQGMGVGPESLVALCMQRSPAMVSAILATLKAGGAYVPLDPTYPAARLRWMLEDAQAMVLITDRVTSPHLPPLPAGLQVIDVEPINLSQQPVSNPVRSTTPDNRIYVIYTSGSTGRPKGVINTHRGLMNRLHWMQDAYGLATGDRVLHKTPLSFDVSAWEVLWPLLNGASTVLCAPGSHGDSAYLVDAIVRQQIDTLHFVPAMLEAFLEAPGVANCDGLRRVICSGEALSSKLQQRFFETFNANTVALYNLYGPTEAAIDVTAWACQASADGGEASVPIGYPIANTQIHLLDSQGRQVPIGIPGELHIGGAGLARGYLHRPDLTAAAFIPNPFGPTDAPRLYKTGDLARYRPDGAIAFLGRLDHQVKLRGFRIERGEIEACLARHPGVRQAIVNRREDPPGHPQLIAYVVPSAGGELSALALDEIRNTLKPHLPDYMMPTAIMSLPELPLLPNGKIDRRALPAPQGAGAPADAFVAPRNATETHLATLWREILHVERVGIHDPFFTLGGNSLIATRLTSRLRAAFDLDLPLRTLFERPTIAALAAHIEALQMALQHRDHAETPGRKEITL